MTAQKFAPAKIRITANNPRTLNNTKQAILAIYPHAIPYRATATVCITKKTRQYHLSIILQEAPPQ